jgi:hypothetical protein
MLVFHGLLYLVGVMSPVGALVGGAAGACAAGLISKLRGAMER